MARNIEEMIGSHHKIGDGALTSSFQPAHNGGFSLYAEARLNSFINQASNQQNPSPSIQDVTQAL